MNPGSVAPSPLRARAINANADARAVRGGALGTERWSQPIVDRDIPRNSIRSVELGPMPPIFVPVGGRRGYCVNVEKGGNRGISDGSTSRHDRLVIGDLSPETRRNHRD